MTDKRIGSDGGGIQHHADSSHSGFASPKVLPDGPNWLDPRDATRRIDPGELDSLGETDGDALDWEEDDKETAMWSHRHMAPRASVLSPKLSSQRDAIARRFRQREALYASSRFEAPDGPDSVDTQPDDSAELATTAPPPEAQKRYVYRSHLPLEPEDFIPTLAEPIRLAPLLMEPDHAEFSADATNDLDLDEVELDDDPEPVAWTPPPAARSGAPLQAAHPSPPHAATQLPAAAVRGRTPVVDYPQMRPLHETFAPSPARPGAQRPRPAPERAARQPRAADPRWAMLGAETHSPGGPHAAEHPNLTQPAGPQRARHDAAAAPNSSRRALPEPTHAHAQDAAIHVRASRRATPPMGVVLRRPPAVDPAMLQSAPPATDPRAAAQAGSGGASQPAALARAPQQRPAPARGPAQPASMRAEQPPANAARAQESSGAPQPGQARRRHTDTIRFVAVPDRAPHAAGTPTSPRPGAAPQASAPQRAAQAAPALSHAPPQSAAPRDTASAQRQPNHGAQPHARPTERRPAPQPQFATARSNTAAYGDADGAAAHATPQPSRGVQLAQPTPARPIEQRPAPQPRSSRARMNTVAYDELPRPTSQLAPGQAAARGLHAAAHATLSPQPSPAGMHHAPAHALAQAGQAGPEARFGRERLPRVARKDVRRGQPQLASPRPAVSLQSEPLTPRGLQPAPALRHTRPGLQSQRVLEQTHPPQLRAQPRHLHAPIQPYAVPPQPAPRFEPAPSPLLQAPAMAWPAHDDEEPLASRRSARGRYWLLGSMTAAGLLGSIVIGRLLLSAPSPATLAIETLPFDASVAVDGRTLPGSRSPYRAQELSAGEHLLVVEKPGFVTHAERVTLREGEERRLATLVLTPNPAPAAIPPEPVVQAAALPAESAAQPERPRRRSRPIDADGPRERPERSTGARSSPHDDEGTRSASADSDAADRGSARRHSDEEPTAARERSAPAGEALEEGMLRINSRPWAEVYIDGKRVGTTPQMALRLRPGQHTVELKNPELEMTKTVVVEIEPGQLVTRVVTLE